MRAALTQHLPHTTTRPREAAAPPLRKIHPLLLSASLSLAAGIFMFDLFIPQGVGIPALYMAPVVLVELWSSSKESSLVILIAVICSVLTMAGFFLAPASGLPLWLSIPNRLIALFTIWVTVVLSVLRKMREEEVKTLRGLLPICSYCKKIRDDQGYWKSLEVYIAAHSQADFTHGLCPECGIKHYPDVFAKAAEGIRR
jgi:hypothetical protein